MALSLDGSAHATTGGGATLAPSLSTTGTNRLIFVVAEMNGGPGVSVSDTAGLTWARQAQVYAGFFDQYLELWWAVAPAQLTSDTITITQTSSQFMTVDVFAVAGGDTASPFDGAAVTGTVDPLSITTTNANDFILGAFREALTPSPTAGAGWTQISGADYQLTEYQIVSTTQAGLSVSQTDGAGTANGGIAQAIKASSGGATSAAGALAARVGMSFSATVTRRASASTA